MNDFITKFESHLLTQVEVQGAVPGTFVALDIDIDEAISTPYEATLTLGTTLPVEVAELPGKEVTVALAFPTSEPRLLRGVISEVSEWFEGGEHPHRVRVSVVPRLWLLGRGQRSRIFQNQSAPEIVAKILTDWSIAHETEGFEPPDYAVREYCVQYQESDLAFVSRLLEEEGIFYTFRHDADRSTLVLGDGPLACPSIEGDSVVPFREARGLAGASDAVVTFTHRRELRPGKVSLRDYDYLHSKVDMGVQAEAEHELEKTLEVYEHHGRYADPAVGQKLARVRLERLRWPSDVARGESHCLRLLPGSTFELDEHPRPSVNEKYLVLRVRHRARRWDNVVGDVEAPTNGPEYVNTFECLPARLPYRPLLSFDRPVIAGPQSAVVGGPSGEEIHTDEEGHGRVKVQFYWDREGRLDDASSCWIRVNQGWAGPGWGALYLPRIGQEVIVEFEEGDPDRPIITGRLYNGANTPPVQLPANKTQSTLRSSSSPGANGHNEFRFEDAAGHEQVHLHAQRDLDIAVLNDKSQTVGGNESLDVARNRSREIHQNQKLLVKGNDDSEIWGAQSLSVALDRTTTVGGDHTESIVGSQTIEIGAAHTLTVGAASAETIGGAKAITVGGAYAMTVGAAVVETVGGAKTEIVGMSLTSSVAGSRGEAIGGDWTSEVGGDQREQIGKTRHLTVGRDAITSVKGKHDHQVTGTYAISAKELQLNAEDELTIKVGSSSLIMKKNGDIVIKGGKIEITATGDVIVKGAKIGEN